MSIIQDIELAMLNANGSSAYRNDRERPYDGQPHTDYGVRGSTEVKGITFRDLRDCFIKGCLLAGGRSDLVESGTWHPEQIYALNWDDIDPIAIAQNMSCEVEKIMGIFPNVPQLIVRK